RQTVATWFVGYTKQITTAVMYVRGDTGHEDLGASWYGGGAAAQTWASYMRIAMKGLPREGFLGPTKRKSTMTPSPEMTPTPTYYPSWTPEPTAPATSEAPTSGPSTGVPTATSSGLPTPTSHGT
ncbi:MAG: penicillin-binding protein, partial [Propionibacteriales bacterium]|nr:penicillin-binding protein [Propionibacteriales bacterium]